MSDWRYVDGNSLVDLDDWKFGPDRLRNPAIVIPNRTRRWFHDWKPGVLTDGAYRARVEKQFVHGGARQGGKADAMRQLTGLHEQVGISIPITSINGYLGISRAGYNKPDAAQPAEPPEILPRRGPR